jgi:polysaccharide export outer membrane protein
MYTKFIQVLKILLFAILTSNMLACGGYPLLDKVSYDNPSLQYIIGPGDTVRIFVWGNNELSAAVPVRPDGKITTPLVEDVQASGKTSTQLAREMEKHLARYIKNPIVTVYVTGFVGRYQEQIRVIGEATEPKSLPYKEGMTVLDVMIAVGGLTNFANGDAAVLARIENGNQRQYRVRLDDLIKEGDITANVYMLPGDVLIIPEAWF